MTNIQVRITNLPQIKAAFGKSPALMTKELNLAIRKSIFTIGRQSRINTPVDTGRLRSSHRETFSSLRGEVGPNTNYALFVHEGTRFMRGRPFLKRAVESSNIEVQMFFTQAVDNVMKNITRRIR